MKTPACTIHHLGEDFDFSREDFREMVLRLSHEVRNPLASIKSSAQLMHRLQMNAEKASPYLESVVSEVSRIDATIRKLEFYASLQLRSKRVVELGSLLQRALADDRRFKLATSPESGLLKVRVQTDPKLVEIALKELLANAVQFSPGDGKISVLAERLSDNTVAVHVENGGSGIPESLIDQIGRPFFSTSTQGVGLGLNIVRRASKLLGWHAYWNNLAVGGCRFSLAMPEA